MKIYKWKIMPIQTPEEFKLEALKLLLVSIESNNKKGSTKWKIGFSLFGVILFLIVYTFQNSMQTSVYWLYLLSAIGGASICGSALIHRIEKQSDLWLKYVDVKKLKIDIHSAEKT